MMMRASLLTLVAILATPAFAQSDMKPAEGKGDMARASAALKGLDGAEHGTISLRQTPHGVLVHAELTGLPPGVHGFHIHTTGACEPPFQSAGGHFNPSGVKHGILAAEGPHAGDMPNIHVPESGALEIEYLNPMVSLTEGGDGYLLDDDGSAMMIHAGADDYASDPTGNAGDRIACGVIE